MGDFLGLRYTPVVPGADSNTYVLFDSTASKQVGPNANVTSAYLRNYWRYVLNLRNSQPGVLIAEFSDDKGATWQQYAQQAVVASTAQRSNQIGIPISGFDAVRISWINGGSAQSTWAVHQWLDDTATSGFYADPSGSPNAQLPTSLGQKTASQSLSKVEASDSALWSAASARAPIRGELLVVPVSNLSVTYNVPAAWLGKFINMFADGADVYIQLSLTATLAVVDDTVSSTVSGPGPYSLAAAGNEAWKIPAGQWLPIPVPSTAQTFAIKGSVASKQLRTHVAQT